MHSKTTSLAIKQVIKAGINQLKSSLKEEAFLDALIILEFVLKKDRAWILAHDEEKISVKDYKTYKKLINQRAKFWPIAYLTGEKYFYGYKFLVNKNVLIPRPESELIVDLVLPLLNKDTILIDLGTGSGCLIISVLMNNKNIKQALAIDLSQLALNIAKNNAKTYNLDKKITFIKSDLLNNINLQKFPQTSNLIIIANLPYLKTSETKEPSIKYEPKQALTAGIDGLKYYRQLAKQLKKTNHNLTLICEINPEQKTGFKKIFPKASFRKDLSKKIRLGIIKG